ncbi:MAG: AAA family ATPase [Candidatus Hodarchaeales archaeon]
MVSWTHKYAPQTRSEVVGNTTSVNSIIGYLNRFRNLKLRTKKSKNALLLFGPPGIGKTSSVLAIAQSLNFDVVIVNASDKRNKASLQTVRNASLFSSLEESLNDKVIGQILLIDEVDGLSGSADRGGIREIIDIIKSTRVPIILTANEISNQKFKTLRTYCELSRFDSPEDNEILRILKRISAAESITVSDEVLLLLIENSNHDIRGSINSLQTLSIGRQTINEEDLSILSYRDQSVEIREFLRSIFIERDGEKAYRQTRLLADVDHNKLLLILRDVTARIIGQDDFQKLSEVYSLLAQADLALTRASSQRIWSQLYYFYFHVTKGLTALIPSVDYLPPFQDWQLQVPQFWITLSRQRRGKNIALKVGKSCLVSANVAIRDFFPYLRIIFNNDPEMAAELALEFKLFDIEPGKRKTKIVWNKEIDYFAKDIVIKKKIKSLIQTKFPLIEKIQKQDIDEAVLLEAQEQQVALKKAYKLKVASSRKNQKEPKNISKSSSKQRKKTSSSKLPAKKVVSVDKVKVNKSKKKEKKSKKTTKTLAEYF